MVDQDIPSWESTCNDLHAREEVVEVRRDQLLHR